MEVSDAALEALHRQAGPHSPYSSMKAIPVKTRPTGVCRSRPQPHLQERCRGHNRRKRPELRQADVPPGHKLQDGQGKEPDSQGEATLQAQSRPLVQLPGPGSGLCVFTGLPQPCWSWHWGTARREPAAEGSIQTLKTWPVSTLTFTPCDLDKVT